MSMEDDDSVAVASGYGNEEAFSEPAGYLQLGLTPPKSAEKEELHRYRLMEKFASLWWNKTFRGMSPHHRSSYWMHTKQNYCTRNFASSPLPSPPLPSPPLPSPPQGSSKVPDEKEVCRLQLMEKYATLWLNKTRSGTCANRHQGRGGEGRGGKGTTCITKNAF